MKFELGLSSRRKFPVFYICGTPVLPHKALWLMYNLRWLKRIAESEEDILFEAYGQRLKLLRDYASVMTFQWCSWEKGYLPLLPKFSLMGKTVLDVGAGCGETSFFFFLHGAKRVVAIEPNQKAVLRLIENAEVNDWNVEIINDYFSLKHMSIPHDWMQMSINGGEQILIDNKDKVEFKTPCVIKVHGVERQKEFVKMGFIQIARQGETNLGIYQYGGGRYERGGIFRF